MWNPVFNVHGIATSDVLESESVFPHPRLSYLCLLCKNRHVIELLFFAFLFWSFLVLQGFFSSPWVFYFGVCFFIYLTWKLRFSCNLLFPLGVAVWKTSYIAGADNTILDVQCPGVHQTGRWHFVLCPSLTNWEIVYGLEQLCWGKFWMGSSFKNSPGDFWLKTECCYCVKNLVFLEWHFGIISVIGRVDF